MTRPFADRLNDAVVARNCPGVIALDPVPDRIPDAVTGADTCKRLMVFSSRVLEQIAPLVPAVKFNIACFEPFGAAGIDAYHQLIERAQQVGLLVIGDIKRGDVAHTARLYAQAQLSGAVAADAVTINGYIGRDCVAPFIEEARASGRGLFVLVRTSNESAVELQDLETADGRKVHEVLASLVDRWAAESETMGACGYAAVGAVVATRNRKDAARLRDLMPRSIFLVPGYGAQGGTAEDFAPYLRPGGAGALIAAGRSVIFAHENTRYRDRYGDDWAQCVQAACHEFAEDLRRVIQEP